MNSVSTKRIPLKHITITQVEGEIGKLLSGTYESWAEADAAILAICRTGPKAGGYFKTDFQVVFLDNETYAGRIDCAHPESKAYDGSLSDHVRTYLTFSAGLAKPKHMSDTDYADFLKRMEEGNAGARDYAMRFLTTYALTDTPPASTTVRNDSQRVTPTVPSAQVATIDTTPILRPVEQVSVTPSTTPDKGVPMTTAITSQPTTAPTVHTKTAKEAHDENVLINNGAPLVAVTGNTFPVKGLLYAFGGKWDSKAKTWSVPAHKHAEAQAAADKFAKPAAKAAPAVTVTPKAAVAPKALPADLTTPKAISGSKASPTSLERRIDFLMRGAEHILLDARGTSAEAALQAAVTALKGLIG